MKRSRTRFGDRHASTVNCSSLGLNWRSRVSAKYMVHAAWPTKPEMATFPVTLMPRFAANGLVLCPAHRLQIKPGGVLYAFVVIRLTAETLS